MQLGVRIIRHWVHSNLLNTIHQILKTIIWVESKWALVQPPFQFAGVNKTPNTWPNSRQQTESDDEYATMTKERGKPNQNHKGHSKKHASASKSSSNLTEAIICLDSTRLYFASFSFLSSSLLLLSSLLLFYSRENRRFHTLFWSQVLVNDICIQVEPMLL